VGCLFTNLLGCIDRLFTNVLACIDRLFTDFLRCIDRLVYCVCGLFLGLAGGLAGGISNANTHKQEYHEQANLLRHATILLTEQSFL
jgi:hypothetical protein